MTRTLISQSLTLAYKHALLPFPVLNGKESTKGSSLCSASEFCVPSRWLDTTY